MLYHAMFILHVLMQTQRQTRLLQQERHRMINILPENQPIVATMIFIQMQYQIQQTTTQFCLLQHSGINTDDFRILQTLRLVVPHAPHLT